MKGEKLIHIKFEYSAGVQSKRDILSTELDLVRMNKRLKRYKELRAQELEIKMAMERKMRAFKLDIGRLQNLMPEVKIPEILEKAHKKIVAERKAGSPVKEKAPEKRVRMVEEIEVIPPKAPTDDLDAQLLEIQNRLRSLSG